jgi:mRNA export factor
MHAHSIAGGCDKTVRMWSLATGQSQQVAQHDGPVKHIHYIPAMNLLMTGGWDKTLRFWDCRSPTPASSQQ